MNDTRRNARNRKLREWCLLWGYPGIVILLISLLISLKVGDDFGKDNFVRLVTFVTVCALLGMVYYLFLSVLADVPHKRRKGQQEDVLSLDSQDADDVPEEATDNAGVGLEKEEQPKEQVIMEDREETPEITDVDVPDDTGLSETDVAPVGGQCPAVSYADLYRQGCDDYYRNLAARKKEQLDMISAYLHYVMAPFISQEELEPFCTEVMSFAVNPGYEPKPWRGLRDTLTSFDVRHLVWNVTSRLGLGRGKPYSVERCISFIRTMFPDLCEGLDPSTLKNLKATSTTDKIHIDMPSSDGFSFHIPKPAE